MYRLYLDFVNGHEIKRWRMHLGMRRYIDPTWLSVPQPLNFRDFCHPKWNYDFITPTTTGIRTLWGRRTADEIVCIWLSRDGVMIGDAATFVSKCICDSEPRGATRSIVCSYQVWINSIPRRTFSLWKRATVIKREWNYVWVAGRRNVSLVKQRW